MKTFGHLGRRSCFNSFSRRWMFGCQNGWMSWSMLKILHAENMYRRTRRESQLNDFLAVTQISCKGWIFVKTLTINVAKGSTPHVNHILSDRLEKKKNTWAHTNRPRSQHMHAHLLFPCIVRSSSVYLEGWLRRPLLKAEGCGFLPLKKVCCCLLHLIIGPQFHRVTFIFTFWLVHFVVAQFACHGVWLWLKSAGINLTPSRTAE